MKRVPLVALSAADFQSSRGKKLMRRDDLNNEHSRCSTTQRLTLSLSFFLDPDAEITRIPHHDAFSLRETGRGAVKCEPNKNSISPLFCFLSPKSRERTVYDGAHENGSVLLPRPTHDA